MVINEAVTFTATVAPNTLDRQRQRARSRLLWMASRRRRSTLSTAVAVHCRIQDRFPQRRRPHRFGYLASGDTNYTGSTSSGDDDDGGGLRNSGDHHRGHGQPDNVRRSGASRDADGDDVWDHRGHAHRPGHVHDGRSDDRQGQSGDARASGNTATATLTVTPRRRRLASQPGTDTITATYGGDTSMRARRERRP